MAVRCDSLAMACVQINCVDRQLMALLAGCSSYVKQAARFRANAAEVPTPHPVEQVIAKVAGLTRELGAGPVVAEATWRARIAAFIQPELAEHAGLHPPPT